MKIDWSKERCSVCGGEFKASPIQLTNEQTGKTNTRKVMACVRCGDTAFSPEQHLAQRLKRVRQEMSPVLSSGLSNVSKAGSKRRLRLGRGTRPFR